ncbi:TPA: hypothetical protein DEO28_04930 [Candidatus Dependentiae bacterium]|nr:MAG: Methylase involved in ubiquinone/menaquinone biosynthesis [candidate division TM6 bacterium GW2011_GWE2_31_21]KKP53896.1 MAG: Methylase involved in ubiquinone/menaquinone biosynthesis [candidate division TM6 bacterium GW2011_GWF2_33_332]HBS47676.1 hypothetical protein [Candidatus Dependentiae bacterium]HBZ73825.1 hypothetical protein [Candidatus Dependentiae bacterium]
MYSKVKFVVPNKNIFDVNGDSDPLEYYYKPFIGRLYFNRINRTLSLLKSHYNSILEVGYGSGLMLPTLSKITNELHGIDLDSNPKTVSKNLEKVKAKAELVKGNILKTNYLDNKFDLVVGISVFEHINDLQTAICEIHRILKPKGELLVGIPRVDFIMNKFFRLIGFKEIEHHHVSDYKKLLEAVLRDKKFELVSFTHMPNLLPKFAGLYYSFLFKKI